MRVGTRKPEITRDCRRTFIGSRCPDEDAAPSADRQGGVTSIDDMLMTEAMHGRMGRRELGETSGCLEASVV